MPSLYNTTNAALGLPHGAGTINPDSTHDVIDPRVLQHPVVVNWLRAGRLQLIGSSELPQIPNEPTGDDGGDDTEGDFLSVLDQSISAIVEALPELTDEQFDRLVEEEEANSARRGLVSEGAAFDRERERRYGTED